MQTAEPLKATPVDQVVRLPDGRRLGYRRYGDPDAAPVLYFHGTPHSRLGLEFLVPAARTLGVRVLAIDRPGHGISDFQPGRRLLDWPADVTALADALGLDRFGVLGWSGGGPYVAVCAYALPDRLTGAAIASGVGPLDGPGDLGLDGLGTGVGAIDRRLIRLARRSPWAARAMLGTIVRLTRWSPELTRRRFGGDLSPSDRRLLASQGPAAEAMAFFVESCRRGTRGPVEDYRIIARPWGFQPEAITVPVQLWHGDQDTLVPLHQAQDLARRIPRARLTVCPGEGHLLIYQHYTEMLRVFATGA